MSFLPDDDHKATLAATLAFIDECDYHSGDDDLTSNGGFSSGNDVRSTDDESDGRDDDDDDDDLRPHRRVRGGTSAAAAPLPPKTAAAGAAATTVDLFATTSGSAKRPSLRVVIRTTNNKRLTAAAPPTATTGTTAAAASTAPPRLADKPVKRTSARAPTPMERPSYPNKESVLRFRARKKAEAERLRTEVVELEAEVAKLRKRGLEDQDDERDDASSSSNGTASPSDASLATALTVTTAGANKTSVKAFWMDQAIQQARERYKSEALNQQLKEAIAKQRTMSSALQTLLVNMADTRTSPAAIGIDLLSEAQKETFYHDTFASVENRTMMGLEASVLQMYKFSDAVFAPGVVDSPTQSVQVLPGHPETGPALDTSYVEIRTSTPLGVTFYDGAEMIWNLITTPPVKKDRAYYVTKQERSDTRYQKNYTLFLDRADGTTLELHGYSLLYRYVEANCVMFMWASSLTASSVDGPTIREKGWVTVSRSAHPHIPSALQVCHQIFSDDHARSTAASRFHFGNPTYLDRALAEHEVREFVLSYIVNRTRAQYQNIQTFLLTTLGKYITRHQIEMHVPTALKC